MLFYDGIHDAPSRELIVTGLRPLERDHARSNREAPEQLASDPANASLRRDAMIDKSSND